MSFLSLIFINLRRHRVRTGIGVAGIAFGVAGMLSVVTMLQGAIHMFEQILNKDSEMVVFEKNVSDLFFSNVPLSDVETMARWTVVARADPVLFGIVSSPGNPVITCFGVQARDARLRSAQWKAGSAERMDAVTNGIVLGQRAAHFLKAALGDSVPIGKDHFQVVGIIQTANGFEDGGVFMPLGLAQDFFHKSGVASIVTIKLNDRTQRTAFKEEIAKVFPGLMALENEEFGRTYSQFRILKTTAWAVGSCAFLLGGLSVANTMIMSVFTRIREIAILRVCGFSKVQVAGLIFGESSLVAMSGAVVGVTLGRAAMSLLRHLPFMQGYIDTSLQWEVLTAAISLAFLTGLVGALYPAAFGVKIQAADALRFE